MKKLSTLLTIVMVAMSINLKAADIIIDATTSLATTYANAASGDVIILGDGTYPVNGNLTMTKGITIRAQNPKSATITAVGFLFNTNSIGSVTIKDVVLDGKKLDATLTSYVVDFNGATIVNNILFDNCTISNYGNCFIRANRAEGTCESLKVNNCIFKTIGYVQAYPFFQVSKTKFGTSLELTNSTIADLSNEFIQFYGTAAGNDDAVILFKNNTFYNTVVNTARTPISGKSGKLYVQNNIFVKMPAHTNEVVLDAGVTVAELTNNRIFDYAGGAFLSATAWKTNTGNTDTDPLFKDAANYDFTLPLGSVLITNNIGDPRWFTGYATKVKSSSANVDMVVTNQTIQMSATGYVEVYTVTGKLVRSAKNVTSLSVGELTNGVYLAKANMGGQVVVQKFVVR